jgi:hypothetical protein
MGGITSWLQSRLLQAGELPRPSTGIGYRQNEDLMAFTARAFRTVFGVPDRPLQQRAAQQFAAHRQFADRLLARSEGLLTRLNQRPQTASTSISSDLAVFRW